MGKNILELIRDDHRRIAHDLDAVVTRAGIAAAWKRAKTTTIVSNSDTGTVTGTSTTTTGGGTMSGMTGPIPSISGPAPSAPGTAPGSIHTSPGGIGTTGTAVSSGEETWMEHSKEVFEEFLTLLSLHMESEEAVLYPLLKERFPKIAADAEREHTLMKALLERMDGFRWNDAVWMEDLSALREILLHHLSDEEEKILPRIQEMFGLQDLDAMGQRYSDLMQRGSGRPAEGNAAFGTA